MFVSHTKSSLTGIAEKIPSATQRPKKTGQQKPWQQAHNHNRGVHENGYLT